VLAGWGEHPALILNDKGASDRLRRGADGEWLLAMP
jgi:hypothetical protein